MDSLSYSEVRAYKSGRNQGIYYVEATLPKEHWKICGRKQDQRKLGRNLSDARRLAPQKIKEGNEWYRKKLEEHNPLVASAEALLKTIVVTYNSNGAPRSQADWSGRAVSPEQLKE